MASAACYPSAQTGVRALLARQRRAGALGAVRAGLARLTLRLLLLVLKRAFSARRAETHLRVSCECAGATGLRRDAARGRVEARLGRVALRGAAEVGTTRVRAILARQRRARAKRAEVPRLAGDTRLLALVGLVRAGFALVARAHLGAGRNGTGAALGLLCAARWCKVARGGLGALTAAREVGRDGVRALFARQCCACALVAVRARLAGDARKFALVGLVLASRALDARGHARVWRDRAGAALGLLGAARRRKASLFGRRALTDAREVGGDRVRTSRARQRRASARWAKRAGPAGNARLLALAGLVRACCALVAGALLCDGLDGARAALGLLGATRRRGVARAGCLRIRALLARQRRAGTLRAVRARLAGNAPILALVGLVRACCAPVAHALACDGLDCAGAALGLLGAARRCIVARISPRALVSAAEVDPIRVRALAARQWRRRALRTVRAWHAHVAFGLAGLVHELARAALDAGGLLRLVGAARWRRVAHIGLGALVGAGEVGGDGVRALLARQRRAGALGTVRARLTGNARLLALAGLVLACRAHDARCHARVWRDRAWAARRLLGAAGWRKVAHGRRRALVGAGKAGGAGVRALLARQRRASARRAVRAGFAGDARLLALALLVRAGRALVARGHARVWRDRARAALTRLRRARTACRSRRALEAVVGARHREVEMQHRLVLVGACLARQRGRRALCAVRAGRARPAHQLARRGLKGASLALETRSRACVGRDRAGAALCLPGATGWRVVALGSRRAFRLSCEVGGVRVRALLARQRCAGALGAVRAGLAGDARLLALIGLVLAGRALETRAHACVGCDRAGAALGLQCAAYWRRVALARRRALVGAGEARSVRRRACAKWAVVTLCARDLLGRCVRRAVEASGAKPCTCRARLLVGERSVAAEYAGRACKRGWVLLPVAGLVEGGGLTGTGRDVAVVDVVNEVYRATCGGLFASGVGWGTRLSPDLALGRGYPVARWRGKHVGGAAAGAEVEIRAFCGAVGHDPRSYHRECAGKEDTSTLPKEAAGNS
eukprot:scaffold12111_cov66-Phaeocystis_antarctica.AAC.3